MEKEYSEKDDVVAEVRLVERRSSAEIALILSGFYDKEFSGRPRGRYRILRRVLKQISGRNVLDDEYLEDIRRDMLDLGFIFVNADSYFAVMDLDMTSRYRRVTKTATEGLIILDGEDLL